MDKRGCGNVDNHDGEAPGTSATEPLATQPGPPRRQDIAACPRQMRASSVQERPAYGRPRAAHVGGPASAWATGTRSGAVASPSDPCPIWLPGRTVIFDYGEVISLAPSAAGGSVCDRPLAAPMYAQEPRRGIVDEDRGLLSPA